MPPPKKKKMKNQVKNMPLVLYFLFIYNLKIREFLTMLLWHIEVYEILWCIILSIFTVFLSFLSFIDSFIHEYFQHEYLTNIHHLSQKKILCNTSTIKIKDREIILNISSSVNNLWLYYPPKAFIVGYYTVAKW